MANNNDELKNTIRVDSDSFAPTPSEADAPAESKLTDSTETFGSKLTDSAETFGSKLADSADAPGSTAADSVEAVEAAADSAEKVETKMTDTAEVFRSAENTGSKQVDQGHPGYVEVKDIPSRRGNADTMEMEAAEVANEEWKNEKAASASSARRAAGNDTAASSADIPSWRSDNDPSWRSDSDPSWSSGNTSSRNSDSASSWNPERPQRSSHSWRPDLTQRNDAAANTADQSTAAGMTGSSRTSGTAGAAGAGSADAYASAKGAGASGSGAAAGTASGAAAYNGDPYASGRQPENVIYLGDDSKGRAGFRRSGNAGSYEASGNTGNYSASASGSYAGAGGFAGSNTSGAYEGAGGFGGSGGSDGSGGFRDSSKKKKRKAKKKMSNKAKIAMVLIACMLVGGGSGYAGSAIQDLTNDQPTTTAQDNKTSEGTAAGMDNDTLENATGSSMTVKEISEAVSDTIVEIRTESTATDDFFSQYVTEGAGSGIIIKENGYIMTNNHVIEGAHTIKVTLKDGTEYQAKLVATDEQADVAVIKVDATGLPAVKYGDSSKLEIGDLAVVIGNPLGELGGTVTGGIISSLDREIQIDGQTMTLLQTDASINPGNSGGGLFNEHGELVGMVVAKSSGTGVEGLGFAIPINTAAEVAQQLIDNGKVTGRAAIGISILSIEDQQTAFQYGVSELGVYIGKVNSEEAKKAGLQIGDRIVSIGDKKVENGADLSAGLQKHKPGEKVKIKVVRDDKEETVEVTLIEQTEQQ